MKIGEKKQSQIITTISQQNVGYDEQWLVVEIAAIIKDIKDNIATVMKVETDIIASITASPKLYSVLRHIEI